MNNPNTTHDDSASPDTSSIESLCASEQDPNFDKSFVEFESLFEETLKAESKQYTKEMLAFLDIEIQKAVDE